MKRRGHTDAMMFDIKYLSRDLEQMNSFYEELSDKLAGVNYELGEAPGDEFWVGRKQALETTLSIVELGIAVADDQLQDKNIELAHFYADQLTGDEPDEFE